MVMNASCRYSYCAVATVAPLSVSDIPSVATWVYLANPVFGVELFNFPERPCRMPSHIVYNFPDQTILPFTHVLDVISIPIRWKSPNRRKTYSNPLSHKEIVAAGPC